ncbi:nuclear transport factor 2 family protein [Streptomyces chartreusis]
MSNDDIQEIKDLILHFADACSAFDSARFARSWAEQGTWTITGPNPFTVTANPDEFEQLHAKMLSGWDGFIQLIHSSLVTVSGDTATARSYVTEIGQPHGEPGGYTNHGLYLDQLIRTPQGWRFAVREYHYRYLDTSPLTGQLIPPPA